MNQLNRYIFSVVILLLVLFSDTLAQQPDREEYTPSIREIFFFGGNFGLQFGTYTYIDVSPIAGFWLTPRLAFAAGPSYKYIKNPLDRTNVFGGKTFSRVVLIQDLNNIIPIGYRMSIYLHCEYEILSYKSDYFYTTYTADRFLVKTVFGGFGISQYVGPRSSINFSVLWVLNETEIDVYDSPEFRIGFTF